jgi:hypothetical protein
MQDLSSPRILYNIWSSQKIVYSILNTSEDHFYLIHFQCIKIAAFQQYLSAELLFGASNSLLELWSET